MMLAVTASAARVSRIGFAGSAPVLAGLRGESQCEEESS
jgi:hypothetical protein